MSKRLLFTELIVNVDRSNGFSYPENDLPKKEITVEAKLNFISSGNFDDITNLQIAHAIKNSIKQIIEI